MGRHDRGVDSCEGDTAHACQKAADHIGHHFPLGYIYTGQACRFLVRANGEDVAAHLRAGEDDVGDEGGAEENQGSGGVAGIIGGDVLENTFEPAVSCSTGREGGTADVGNDRAGPEADHHRSEGGDERRELQAADKNSVEQAEAGGNQEDEQQREPHRPAPCLVGCSSNDGGCHHDGSTGEVDAAGDDDERYPDGDEADVVGGVEDVDQRGVGEEVSSEQGEECIDDDESQGCKQFL